MKEELPVEQVILDRMYQKIPLSQSLKSLQRRNHRKSKQRILMNFLPEGWPEAPNLNQKVKGILYLQTFQKNNEHMKYSKVDSYGDNHGFAQAQKEEGIGYAEKVMSFLDDQANTPQITKDIAVDDPLPKQRRKDKATQRSEVKDDNINNTKIIKRSIEK